MLSLQLVTITIAHDAMIQEKTILFSVSLKGFIYSNTAIIPLLLRSINGLLNNSPSLYFSMSYVIDCGLKVIIIHAYNYYVVIIDKFPFLVVIFSKVISKMACNTFHHGYITLSINKLMSTVTMVT